MYLYRFFPILLPAVLISASAIGEQTGTELPQLMQLNRSSQQELRNIQGVPEKGDPQVEQLNRRQTTEQQVLQEDQRREVLMHKQRAKVAPATGRPQRLQAIDRQSRFRVQQQNQLNRFRIQQGVGRR